MSQRFKMGKVQPAAYKAMDGLDNYISGTSVAQRQQELIRLRASQINGCAYCVNYHSSEAMKIGESAAKLLLTSAWHEAANVFTEEEQVMLEMTEEITYIHKHGLREELYQKALALFGEQKTAEIIMIIVGINAWNRIGVALKMEPEV